MYIIVNTLSINRMNHLFPANLHFFSYLKNGGGSEETQLYKYKQVIILVEHSFLREGSVSKERKKRVLVIPLATC